MSGGDKNSNTKRENIEQEPISKILGEKYLAYALSTITSRSLPDVRDGLKPVHRRILWAMHLLKLDPEKGFKKCARVVGDVIGKYHPHGDVAVYDALVRLAQSFSVRYPLINGQGNFGSIDGDNAAAMRYTEAKMTPAATLMLRDIDKQTVDFRPTYDGLEEEPELLPAYFPNLLANGSDGIAVGMATAIPPHNAEELLAAAHHLIDKYFLTNELDKALESDLTKYVKGPDFPTGGVLVESKENISRYYKEGKGSFRIRASYSVEQLERGNYQIVITEIPYQIQKSKLLEKIANYIDSKRLPLIGNIRDESDENIRVIIEPKTRNVDAEVVMQSLFKITDLESRYNMNLNVLNENLQPKLMSLNEALICFIKHNQVVLQRKSRYELDKIEHRLEVVKGLLIAYLNLDEIIKIIREEDDAKQIMITRFSLTEIQVEAILNMKLRSLRKLEEIQLTQEATELEEKQAELKNLLSSEELQFSQIKENFSLIKTEFGKKTSLGKRRTQVDNDTVDEDTVVSIEAFVNKEPLTISCSKLGWIRSFKGFDYDLSSVKFKDGDKHQFSVNLYTTDYLIIATKNGKFYSILGDNISGGKGFGDPLRVLLDIDEGDNICDIFRFESKKNYLLVSKSGRGFFVESDSFIAQTKTGKSVFNIKEGDALFKIIEDKPELQDIAIIGDNRRLLLFKKEEIPTMKRGSGVLLQKYRDGGVSDIKICSISDGITWTSGKRNYTHEDTLLYSGKRAARGKTAPRGFSADNKF